ncbi:MAG TPA: ATP-binding protein [Terriglobales bacterium]|nr:ATP-binding protein [Terriglobales bacterium]
MAFPAAPAPGSQRPRWWARGSARRRRILLVGGALLILIAVLFYPQAVSIRFVPPNLENTWLLFLLSALVFLAIVILSFVLLRQLLKLYAERRANVLGAKFKTKLVIGALGLSLIPVVCMFAFTYGLINRTLDKWFSRPVEAVRDDTARLTGLLENYIRANASDEAAAIAANPSMAEAIRRGDAVRAAQLLAADRTTLGGGFALVATGPGRWLASYGLSAAPARALPPEPPMLGGEVQLGATTYLLAGASVAGAPPESRVYVGMPVPAPLAARVARLSADYRTYEQLGRERRALRNLYTEYLALLTLAILFAATWFALFLSKLVVVPIQALAQATEEIARGNLGHRIEVKAKDEILALVESFNRMAADLEIGRRQLEAANAELDGRRRFMETLLESIPSAVLLLDRERALSHVNPAVTRLFGERAQSAHRLDDLFDGESRQELSHLFRKSERLGVIAGQMEITGSGPGRSFTAAVTVAAIRRGAERAPAAGYVVMIEDLTDVLRMQRVAAWREVARRIAHEIKNPLTPIALSAQRIRRWLERQPGPAPSAALVAECAQTIETEVRSLETLVDEFSAFARFPASRPVPCDLNAVIERALRNFDGRLDGIRVRTRLGSLPSLRLDPEEMHRVFVNLIDNAAEALQHGSYREITIGTEAGDGVVEAYVADTGPGISAADKERIFLPYVSSKRRGTGLGLAIVSRIVADHGANLRVEDNAPVGTRFVIEFPLADSANGARAEERTAR